MWHGTIGQPQGLTRAERTDAAERSGAALREAYALLRQERATNRYLSELGRHGTPEPEEVAEGDHVVVLHGHAARRSKRYYSSHYRRQIFRIINVPHPEGGPSNRVFISSAYGDQHWRGKQPLSLKKVRRVPASLAPQLTFPN